MLRDYRRNLMSIFVYEKAPIDFWAGWVTEDDFKQQLRKEGTDENFKADWNKYLAFRNTAQSLASDIGWEGDVTSGPYVSAIPMEDPADSGHVIVAWKQENNGTTYIASPQPLPWLQEGKNWKKG